MNASDLDTIREILLYLPAGYSQDVHDARTDGPSRPPGVYWQLTYQSPYRASYVTFKFDAAGKLLDIEGED